MRQIMIVPLLAAALVAGCADQRPRAGPNTFDPVNKGQFFYQCHNGERVEVMFTPTAGVAVLIRGEERMEMQRQATARGFIYTNGGTQIEGNGNRLDIVAPGLPTLHCRMEQ